MIRTYTSRPTTSYERGADFGRHHAGGVRGTLKVYERLFAEAHGLSLADIDQLGEQVLHQVVSSAPELAAEIEGMAQGADVPAIRLAAVNARTEILAGGRPPECSVIGVDARLSSTGSTILAQNWDWHPDLRPQLVLWTVHDEFGAFTTLTEAGILAKIGRNTRGLAVCLNIMTTSLDGGIAGMPIHLALRLLLQRCGSWNEAARLMSSLRFAASSAITVAALETDGHMSGGPEAGDRGIGGNYRLGTFEVSPSGHRFIEPQNGLLLHTNHFRQPHQYLVDTYRRDWPDTLARLEDLEATLGGMEQVAPHDVKDALRSHRAGRIAVCCHDEENPNHLEQQSTLASLYMEMAGRVLEVAQGNPCQNLFVASDAT